MIHEQNSIIGLTNKILIKNVDKIVCCYDKAYENFPKDKTYKLGNPRASVIASIKPDDIFKKYHLNKNFLELCSYNPLPFTIIIILIF